MAHCNSFLLTLVCAMACRCRAIQLMLNSTQKATSHSPVMMLSHGCSMTTAGINMVGKLLKEHGIVTADSGNGEMLKSLDRSETKLELSHKMGALGKNQELIDKIWGYGSDHLKEKFEVVYDWAQNDGTTLFWKNEVLTLNANPEAVAFMKKVNTKPFLFLRTNLIDVLHCRVTDFCDQKENLELGVPVDASGTELSCGFRGRAEAKAGTSGDETTVEANPTVKLFAEHVLDRLERAEGGDKDHERFLEDNGFNHKVFSSESLFEFEYGSGPESPEFKRSQQAWSELLSSIDITPNPDKIKQSLIDFGTFPPPPKHSETFYNFDEIKDILKGTKYYDMLRM